MFAATGAQPAIRSLICPDVPRTEIALSGMRRRRPSGRAVTLRWPLTRAVGRPASVRAAARRPRRRQQMVTTDALERNYRPSRRPDGICPKCSYTAEAAAPRANGPVHRCLFSLRGRSAGGQTYATGWKTPPSLSLCDHSARRQRSVQAAVSGLLCDCRLSGRRRGARWVAAARPGSGHGSRPRGPHDRHDHPSGRGADGAGRQLTPGRRRRHGLKHQQQRQTERPERR